MKCSYVMEKRNDLPVYPIYEQSKNADVKSLKFGQQLESSPMQSSTKSKGCSG